MEASLAFYRDLLGFVVVNDVLLQGVEASRLVALSDVSMRCVTLSLDGRMPFIELIQCSSPESRPLRGDEAFSDVGFGHLSILVDDFHGECLRLKTAGVRFTGEPLIIDEGPFEGECAAFCFDPDGQLVELSGRP
jgi:catechol 2,3-dioxygenase-like lactoylglutathione lyase family enzyme